MLTITNGNNKGSLTMMTIMVDDNDDSDRKLCRFIDPVAPSPGNESPCVKKKKTFKYSMKPTHQISVLAGALAHSRSICRDQVGEDKRR